MFDVICQMESWNMCFTMDIRFIFEFQAISKIIYQISPNSPVVV